MTAINNKIQQSILPLSTSYCLTNSSLENNRSEINDQDVIIGEQWIVLAKIGEGSFGEVFEVKDINTGRHYAVKREPRSHLSQIKHESILYDILAAGPGIPQCHWYGRHEEFDCIVMDLLGTSLKQLRQSVRHIPLSIIKDLGCQMIDILEHIHNRGLLYRDVKPDNFLFSESCRLPGYDKYDDDDNSNNNAERKWEYESCQQVFDTWKETKPKLYVVDLGLASCWRNLETKQPYPECKKRIRNKTGTARYASLNVHRGKTPARRDDMESLGYLLVDLALGSLPWTGIQAKSSKAGWDRMHMMKENIQIADLCSGLPSGFMTFIDYTRRLGFNDQPDYQYLRQLLLTACVQNGQSITATTTTISGNKTKQDHRYQKRGWRTTEKIKNKNYEDVFHMDDLAHDLPIISTNKKLSTIISTSGNGNDNGGRRRRNSKKSVWSNGGRQQQQQQQQYYGSTQSSSRGYQNGKQQQPRYQAPHQRTFISKSDQLSSTEDSRNQQHGLADPWSRYKSSFNYHHTSHSHHQHHFQWQQHERTNLV